MSEQNISLTLQNSPRNSSREVLHQTALKAPEQSGVYMWKNEGGTVIYVGKAKNLKKRLTSYFNRNKDIKTRILVSRAKTIEYITTSNEYEAFLLENNLIKKYTPRYNICLKDGKSYPVLRITREKFPKIFKTRRVIQDGSHYFGPFPDATALDSFIETIGEIYPLRRCRTFREKTSPCMYYHIGRCLAPCCKKCDDKTYSEFIGEIADLLEGKGKETEDKLEATMREAAARLNFEKAKRIRDGLKALKILRTQNVVECFDGNDRDYIASWREGELVSFTVLKMRGGKLLGRDNYRTITLNEDEETLPEFMMAFYTEKESIPPSIFVFSEKGTEPVRQWFRETFGDITEIRSVKTGSEGSSMHLAALSMAQQNAKEDIVRRMRERGDYPAMEELKNVLSLPKLPVRIEGFDIAHIGGKFPVASLISFYKGNPDKKNYRYFRLKTTDGLIDDFQSMREACTRRYTRLLNENQELPDLILIDGGIGQVNAVQGVLDSLDLDIPVAGLAKRDEEIWRPGAHAPVCLSKRSDGLRLLQRVRDETHRFATSRNQELRTKENTVSPFTKITGIGEKRDKILMKEFGTLAVLAAETPDKIAALLSVPLEKAEDILSEARKLREEQKAVQKKQSLALDLPGTTKEKAARSAMNKNLALAALEEDQDTGEMEAASPEED